MTIEEIRKIPNEAEQVNAVYGWFDESARLTHSKAANVEFITTVRYIEKYLSPGASILDIGAGAGAYSLYFADKGYAVSSLELADENIKAFRAKIKPEMNVDLRQGNALEMSNYPDGKYDIVLLMGPLYHLHDSGDRSRCIREAMRVLKPNGTMFVSFINHDMVHMTELMYNADYFISGEYDHATMRLNDFPFVFHTVPECRDMLTREGLEIVSEIASDGASELMADRINAMNEESYSQYLKYHLYRCEKPEMLGFSNHLLFVCKK